MDYLEVLVLAWLGRMSSVGMAWCLGGGVTMEGGQHKSAEGAYLYHLNWMLSWFFSSFSSSSSSSFEFLFDF